MTNDFISSSLEMMICRILLLISLNCVCGLVEPRYTGPVYQAEENHNVTVEWRFSSESNISIPSLKIHCVFVVPELKVFYHQDNSVDEPQNEQFTGRVQCDKDALPTGRVRLHVSRVRTEDSGLYVCRMATGSGRKVTQFSLNIAEATVTPKPVIPEPKPNPKAEPEPESRGRIGLFIGLGLVAAAAAVAAGLTVCHWTLSSRST